MSCYDHSRKTTFIGPWTAQRDICSISDILFSWTKKMLEESKTALTSYLFLVWNNMKHELKDHISWQQRMLLILKICIPALLNETHPLRTNTGQLIEMVCSAVCTIQYNSILHLQHKVRLYSFQVEDVIASTSLGQQQGNGRSSQPAWHSSH